MHVRETFHIEKFFSISQKTQMFALYILELCAFGQTYQREGSLFFTEFFWTYQLSGYEGAVTEIRT